MEPVPDRLRLLDPNEQEARELVRGRPDLKYVGRLVNDDPAKRLLPPASERHRILGVDARLFPFEGSRSRPYANQWSWPLEDWRVGPNGVEPEGVEALGR